MNAPPPPPWLLWLNTAPDAEIVAAARAELGEDKAEASKLLTRIQASLQERPFESFADFAGCANIGKLSARLMQAVLTRRGYVEDLPPCRRCRVHCPRG